MDPKTKALKEALKAALECFGADAVVLKAQVERETDVHRLGLMYQALREAYLKEFAESTHAPFKVKLPDGTIKEVKNLAELDELVKRA